MRKAVLAILLAGGPVPALAWGGTGHRHIGEVAARNFPSPDSPLFSGRRWR